MLSWIKWVLRIPDIPDFSKTVQKNSELCHDLIRLARKHASPGSQWWLVECPAESLLSAENVPDPLKTLVITHCTELHKLKYKKNDAHQEVSKDRNRAYTDVLGHLRSALKVLNDPRMIAEADRQLPEGAARALLESILAIRTDLSKRLKNLIDAIRLDFGTYTEEREENGRFVPVRHTVRMYPLDDIETTARALNINYREIFREYARLMFDIVKYLELEGKKS